MARRIFVSLLIAACFVLGGTTLFIVDEMYQTYTQSQMEILKAETQLIAYGIDREGMEFLNGLDDTDYRITVIDSDGTVVFDNSGSDISQMENHLGRKEVSEALSQGYGTSTRQSSTLTLKLVYIAWLLKNGMVVRLSASYASLYRVLRSLAQPLLLVLLLIIGLAFFLAYRLTKRIVDPLDNIDVDKPEEKAPYPEIQPIFNRLLQQKIRIDEDSQRLMRQRQEFETITENMEQGLILMSADGRILEINEAALGILKKDRNELLQSGISETELAASLLPLLQDGQMGHRASALFRHNGRSYEADISPVREENRISGFALLLMDTTLRDSTESLRREFASNVSHELKTPLQAIEGYAELLKSGMVRKEDESVFYDRIHKESKHMETLISDILKLSHLEDDRSTVEKEVLDLAQIAASVVERLRRENEGKARILFEGKESHIYANRELVETIIYNLGDNAVKYGGKDPEVFIAVLQEADKAVLRVRDKGIGIDEKDQERIFERFYRVDKSRSRALGGTGLGLSIVKHACIVNNAEISLKSKLNEGTQFTVRFQRI